MDADDLTIDQWSGFSHKHSLNSGARIDSILPHWCGKEHHRRLRGYITASGYRETVARLFLNPEQPEVAKIWREHGDPGAFSDRLSDATLGDDITIRVPGADEHIWEFPVYDPQPEPPVVTEGGPPEAKRINQATYDAQMRVWAMTAEAAIAEWEEAHVLQQAQNVRQVWLRGWNQTERFEAKLREAETELTTPLGDAVFVFSVKPGEMPTCRIWEPDAYFPVFPDADLVEFPDKVHLAYEFETEVDGETKKWLRRITYEVADKVDETSGEPIETTYPYNGDDGQPLVSTKACFMWDGTWQLDGHQSPFNLPQALSGLDDLSDEAAVWATQMDENGEEVEIKGLDLGMHFMPIVHTPADLATLTHFGRSVYARLAQLFDEIAHNDTDLGRAADLTGKPVIGISGGRLDDEDGTVTYQAGSVLDMGENGKMDKLVMSDSVEALLDRSKQLRQHLSTVGAVPEGILGHVQANQIATGISINLTFTPFRQTITRRRLARLPKVELMLKFVQRLAIVAGEETIDTKEVHPATVVFGSYIPTDRNGLVDIITALADRDLMTPNLAFQLIEEAGIEVGDIETLVHTLRRDRTDKAADLVAIAGREYAQRYLGITHSDVGEEPDFGDAVQEPEVEVPDRESQEPDGLVVEEQPPDPR